MAYPGPAPSHPLLARIRPWGRALLDLTYPRTCLVCDEPLSSEEREGLQAWFCTACEGALPRLQAPFCQICGEPYDGAISGEFRCSNCAGRRFSFEFATSAFRASEGVRALVHRFKYGRESHLREALASLLKLALDDPRLAAEALGEWLLIPVPLHRAKEGDRGFNQSRELCRELSRATGIPTADGLKRVRLTETQARLSREERLRNVRGAFLPREPAALKGRRVLLVDDVLTTGATTNECARVLRREAGAEKVVVITVARG